MTVARLGLCSHCREVMTLTGAGALRVHGPPRRRCPGSGTTPEREVAERPPSRSPFAAGRREDKAARLARTMRDLNATVWAAEHLTMDGRRLVEAAAEVKPCSSTTWNLAIGKLARMLAAAERSRPTPARRSEGGDDDRREESA